MQCLHCFRINHQLHPFHRVESWTGAYFAPSWLWKVGIVIYLGHNGKPCPGEQLDSAHQSENECPNPLSDLPDHSKVAGDGEDIDHDFESLLEDETDGLYNEAEIPDPPATYINGRRVLTYVHSNGIHQLPTSFCGCSDSPSADIQLLRMGLFPSTSKVPQTAFTFSLLDDYILENLECKTSATHYYSKLWRMTSKAFPHTVKVSSESCCLDLSVFHCFLLGSLSGASQSQQTMA